MKDLVLITGGMGYLGGRIAQSISSETKWQVRLASHRNPVPQANWFPHPEVVFLDLMRPETMAGALKGVRAVVHLAALNEIQCKDDPQAAYRVNTIGTKDLLEAAIRAKVERFIYFSTAHVYGAPLAGHLTENSPTKPVHPYASTHLEAEQFVLKAREEKRIQGIVLRLSNGFGAPTHGDVDRWTLLVNDLCMQAVRDKKLVLRSSGLGQRDFVTLEDTGRAVCHFLELSQEDCMDGLFNVGGDSSMTVLAMVQRIVACCQEELNYEPMVIRPEPSANETVLELNYDISKLKHSGFSIKGDINKEIKDTLKICQLMQAHTR